ncbi:MAG: DUF349 domain-containing protein [Acidobacteriota bacterium]
MDTPQLEHLQQLTDLCDRLEEMAGAATPEHPAAVLDEAAALWASIGGAADEALAGRYEALVARLRAGRGPEEDRSAPGTAEPAAPVDVLRATALPASAAEASAQSPAESGAGVSPPAGTEPVPAVDAPPAEALPPLSTEEHDAHVARLVEMLDAADQLLSATDLPDARARWSALRREWSAVVPRLALDEAATSRLSEIEFRIDAREAELKEARVRHQRENLERMLRLCDHLEKVARAEQLALRDAERAMREVRSALDAPGPMPTRQDQQAVIARLKAVQSAIFPRLQDLREADEWERWANAGVQESLIRRLEELRDGDDAAAIARQLRQVQEEWHKVRAVPREKGRDLWQRFKAVEAEVRAKCEDYFQHLAVERAENLRQKELLCEQAEALADSTDWIRTAETIKGFQAQWKLIGPVTPGHEKAVWERFRAACDRFFTRRKQDLVERKTVWTSNLQQKETICAQIEALAESTDWDQALADVKRLQAEWRTVGPVKRSRAEATLLRFRSACERFFDRYAHRNDQELLKVAELRRQTCEALEALLPAADSVAPALPPPDLAGSVFALRRQWEQGPPLPRTLGEGLQERYAAATGRLLDAYPEAFKGTDLDPEQNRARLEQLCRTVEALAGDDGPAEQLSPAAILAAQWREALAANTIGGRVDDDARLRQASEEVKRAQAAWRRVGPVPVAVAHELTERFQRACHRVMKQREARRRPGRS